MTGDDQILALTNGVVGLMAQTMVTTGEAIVQFIVDEEYGLAAEAAASLAADGRKVQQMQFDNAVDGEQP